MFHVDLVMREGDRPETIRSGRIVTQRAIALMNRLTEQQAVEVFEKMVESLEGTAA